ncbi:hypothetical protein vseg_015400 [Gypsophila vaccaria]
MSTHSSNLVPDTHCSEHAPDTLCSEIVLESDLVLGTCSVEIVPDSQPPDEEATHTVTFSPDFDDDYLPIIDWDLPENKLNFDMVCTQLPSWRTIWPKIKGRYVFPKP